MASLKMKNAMKTRNMPFINPPSTSARLNLNMRKNETINLKQCIKTSTHEIEMGRKTDDEDVEGRESIDKKDLAQLFPTRRRIARSVFSLRSRTPRDP